MELSPDQCIAFTDLLRERLGTLKVSDPGFKGLYGLYTSLKTQSDRLLAAKKGGK